MGEWEHLQRNVGEWRGWFDSMDRTFQRTKCQPSLLTLKPAPSGVPLNLTLLLWPEGAGSSSPHQGLRLVRAQSKTRTTTRLNRTTPKNRQQKSPPGEPSGDV